MRHAILFVLISISWSAFAAQVCKDSIVATTPDRRFTVNDGEVTDNVTGLVWRRCSLGQTGPDCVGTVNIYGWQSALRAAELEQAVTGQPWRLPNVKELGSIVEKQCYGPSINLTVFPNTPSAYYWSGSPHDNSTGYAWSVSFFDGYSGFNKGYDMHVRLVRGGQ